MSVVRNVEENVVKMTFDNKNFDKNVKDSQKTVTGFDTALNELKNTAVQIPADIMQGLSRVLQNVNIGDILGLGAILGGVALIKNGITGIGDTIESVAQKALGTINQVMTAAMNQIKTGGKARAENIQQAKFMIEGLNLDVETFMEASQYAVADTAYGLDAAAKAAAQFGASGVTASEKLKYSLRGISGVASMTNSSYEEIAHIFTTIAGNGRLMTEQMNSLSIKGLNVASTLGKAMNKTEAEIRDMVSKGQISFDMFAKAMDDTFGAHAKEANKTFSGVMSNIRAALSKIGAEFYGPLISDTLGFLDKLRAGLNKFKSTLGDYGVYESFQKAVANISKTLENFTVMLTEALDKAYGGESLMYEISALAQTVFGIIERIFDAFSMKYSIELTDIIVGITYVVWGIRQFIQIMESAVDEVFGITNIGSAFKGLIYLVGELLQEIGLIFYSDEYSKDGIRGYDAIREVFVSWLTTIKEIAIVIKDILGINSDNIKSTFKDIVHSVFNFFTNLKISDDEIDKLTRTASGLASVVDIIRMFAVQLLEFLKPALGIIRPLIDGLLEGSATLGDWLTNLRNTIKEEQVFETVFEKLGNVAKFIKDVLSGVKKTFFEAFFGDEAGDDGKRTSFFTRIVKFISGIFETIGDALGKIDGSKFDFSPIKKIFDNLSSFADTGEKSESLFKRIQNIFERVKEFFSNFKSGKKEITEDLKDEDKNSASTSGVINVWKKWLGTILDGIAGFIKKITDSLAKLDPKVLIAATSLLAIIVLAIERIITTAIKALWSFLKIAVIGDYIKKIVEIVSRSNSPLEELRLTLRDFTNKIRLAADTVMYSSVFKSIPLIIDAVGKLIRDVVLSISAALFIVSMIPTDNLNHAVGALAAMMGIVMAFMTILLIFATKVFPQLKDVKDKSTKADEFDLSNEVASKFGKHTESSTKNSKNPLLKFAILIEAIANGILQISAALWIVGKIGSIGQIMSTVLAMFAMLAMIAGLIFGMAQLIDKVKGVYSIDLLAMGATFSMMSGSLLIISASLVLLAKNITPGQAALAAVIVAALMAAIGGIIIGVTAFIQKNPVAGLAAAAAIFLACVGLFASIKAVVKVIKELSKIEDPNKIETIMTSLIGVIVAFGAVITVALAIGGLVGSIGPQALIGMAIVAAALLELALILAAVSGTVATITSAMKSWAEAIKALKEIIEMAKDMSNEDAEGISDRLGKIFEGIAKGIIRGLFSFDNANIDVMSEFVPKLLAFVTQVILPAIATVLTQIIPDVWNQIINFIDTVIGLISQTPMEKVQPIFEFLLVVFEQLLQFIFDALGTLLDKLNENIPMLEEKIFTIVMNIIETFNRLMEENQDAVQKELTQLINNLVLFAATAFLADENVQVIWTTAAAIIDTMVYGIAQSAVRLGEVMQKLARFAMASFFLEWNTFGLFDSEWMFDEMFDQDDFKITPTLDLTQIKAGQAELNDIMSSRTSYQYEGVFAANNSPYNKQTQAQMNTNAVKSGIDMLRTEFTNMMKENKTTLDLNFSSDAYGQLQVLNQEDFIMSGAGWN